MNFFRQLLAVFAVNLGSLPQRAGASLVVVAGIAGVVGVLISVLALGSGLQQTFATTGRSDRAIMTSKGALSESNSSLPRDTLFVVQDAPGVRKNAAGKPILSMEMLTQTRAKSINDGVLKNVLLRGIGPVGMALRPEIHIVQGRMFRTGLHELIVGVPLQAQFQGMAVGDSLTVQNSEWTIVGSFATDGGGAHDSEMFGDVEALLPAFHRTGFQSITVRLTNPAALTPFTTALEANPSLSMEVRREDQYYADQSKGIITLLTRFGYLIGGIMAVGAVFAALNTMYAAVSAQSMFIATLRAIGFNGGAVLAAVFLESMLLALVGALLGTAIAWVLFDGHSLNMLQGSQSQIVFALHISLQLAILGVVWALTIGFLGGLFPAIRAARLPIVDALRAT